MIRSEEKVGETAKQMEKEEKVWETAKQMEK